MPSKDATRKAHARSDPILPIVGARVDAALRVKHISRERVAREAGVSRQTISLIATGTTKKCRRSIHQAIAKLCGRPVTMKYLSGAAGLSIPPRLTPPSGHGIDAQFPLDVAGFRVSNASNSPNLPPIYELEGIRLGQILARVKDLERALGPEYPTPDILNATRWMLSLTLWREFLCENQSIGAPNAESHRAEAAAFAEHLGAAMQILLRPWIDGTVCMRPRMLRRWATVLDNIWGECVIISQALSLGQVSELAILEVSGDNMALRNHLRRWRDDQRARGETEEQIAADIREGDSDDTTAPR